MLQAALYIASYKRNIGNIDKTRLAGCQDRRQKYGQDARAPIRREGLGTRDQEQERSSFSNEMEVAKLSAPPNLEVRYVSCNESAKKRCLSSELEETVFSLTHELFISLWRFPRGLPKQRWVLNKLWLPGQTIG